MRDDTDRSQDGKLPSAARRLRLVHPSPPSIPQRRRGTRPPPVFTADEQGRLRAALKNARALFGTWACLAAALYVVPETLNAAANGRKRVSAEVAVRLARALGKPLESLYAPPSDAAACPTCGARRAP